MKINIHASFEVNDYLKGIIEEKLTKIETFFSPILATDIFLRIADKRHTVAEEQIAEVRINVPNHTFFAEERSDSFEKAVAVASDKIRRQVIKFKEQLPKR
ncbi:MAG: ribosome-associated translation inhibitor RaiA [Bacteroidota bacterium]